MTTVSFRCLQRAQAENEASGREGDDDKMLNAARFVPAADMFKDASSVEKGKIDENITREDTYLSVYKSLPARNR